MQQKRLSFLDRALVEFDRGLRNLAGTNTTPKPSPPSDQQLSQAEKELSVQLMRVNHAGEIAAQALYHGQSLTAKLPDVREAMEQAADEERDHLQWCADRLEELGGRRSLLDPVWYAGSFVIGAAAGLAGDKWSLGFVEETERQVVAHLQEHLNKLSDKDIRTREILEQMQEDEQRHGDTAKQAGAETLPPPVKTVMGLVSKVMTRAALYI